MNLTNLMDLMKNDDPIDLLPKVCYIKIEIRNVERA